MLKKIIITLGGFASCVSIAHAQTSVTLYGIVDAGMTYVSNAGGHSQIMETSGVASGNRWGLRGSEDLGGGLSAIFDLQAGFSAATGKIGQGGTEFGREAFVGLASTQYGRVMLGRQYTTFSDFIGPYSAGDDWAAPGAGYGSHPGDLDNLDSSNRINNSIKYLSPLLAGFQLGAQYSVGGVAGDFTRNQLYSLDLAYSRGPFNAAVGYQNVRNPNFSFWGDKATDSATSNNITSPVILGYATAGTHETYGAGASYAIGNATVSGVYTRTAFKGLGSTAVTGLTATENAYRGSAFFNTGELSAKYLLTPSIQLGASYAYTEGGLSAGKGHYNQVDLGADYLLSKRTDLYALAVYQRAAGKNSTGGPAVAAITGVTASTSNVQTIATVGIRHKF